MLTLKVIHIDQNGGRTTYLFSGERFSHTEKEETTHYNDAYTHEDTYFMIGTLPDSSSKEPYIMSEVDIFDGNEYQKVYILPKAECFIMSNGKTVDAFSTYYKSIDNK